LLGKHLVVDLKWDLQEIIADREAEDGSRTQHLELVLILPK
jgi:hypothetical protein